MSLRMPFVGVVDCATCSRFPLAIKWVLLEVSHCTPAAPGFARARRRPQEQIASTSEDIYFTSYDSHLVIHLSFFHFSLMLTISHSQMCFIMSSIHWFLLSTLMDFPNHQIQDPRRNTGYHHFWCHAFTCLQRYGNLGDYDPLVLIHTVDHNTTSIPSVCLFAAVQETSHRLTVFCIVSFLNSVLLLPFRAQVRQVVGLLIVSTKNASHNRRSGSRDTQFFFFHHGCNVF